jgi:hypothetical protein
LRSALAVSLCAHLLFLFPPHWNGWRSQKPLPEMARLDVILKKAPPAPPPSVPSVPPPPAPPVPPRADPAPDPAPVPPPLVPVSRVETPPIPEDEAEASESEEARDGGAVQNEGMALPPSGTMRYTVYRGDQGFEVGRAEALWQIGDGRYRLGLRTETSGLAALLHPVEAYAESVGSFGADGLRPDHYILTPGDGESAESVEFYWEIEQIRVGRREPEPIHPGSQDILSLQYQLAYMLSPLDDAIGPRAPLEFWVANDKRYRLMQFTLLGREILELPAGQFLTLHLQSISGGKTIDVWLAEDYRMLPVKTRFTDKDGDIYEQAVQEIVIEPLDTEPPNDGIPPFHPLLPPRARRDTEPLNDGIPPLLVPHDPHQE